MILPRIFGISFSNMLGRAAASTMTIFIVAAAVTAQRSSELYLPSVSGSDMGPTASSQSARLLLNTDNPSGNQFILPNTAVVVTASLSNQQYTGVNTGEVSPVVMFGASGQAGSDLPRSLEVLDLISGAGSPSNLYFSGTASGGPSGIDVSTNGGFRLFSSVRQFAGGDSIPTGQSIYLADLTLSFSSPVSDPYLHLSGLGARIGPLTYSTELVVASPGISLERVAGNQFFQVESGSVGTSLSTFTTDLCDAFAGCGTVRVAGKNISSVTFRVYVRGNGGAASWGEPSDHNGDDWMLSISLPQVYDLSGYVLYDADGPEILDGIEIADAGGQPLYVNLIDPTDSTVIGSAALDEYGGYNFQGVPGGGTDHYLELSTLAGTMLEPAPLRTLPANWVNVGEQLRLDSKQGHDGSPDGRIAVSVKDFYYSDALFAVKLETDEVVTVAGRVTDHTGRGMSRCAVRAFDPVTSQTISAYTNTFGYYRLSGLRAGYVYSLSAADMRRGLSISEDILVLNDLSGVDLVFSAPLGL